jgi:hypothetical protein
MQRKQYNIIGIVCLAVSLVCLFIAYERYQDNAGKVQAMNQMIGSTPLAGMMGGVQVEPAMPAASKYALLFAVGAGIAGLGSLLYSLQLPRQAAATATAQSQSQA